MNVTTAVALALLGVSLQRAPAAPEPGFTSLFNGRDLTGWKVAGPQESFSVRDGAIVTTGATSHLYYDGPFQDHSFRNFELKVDVMTRRGANGGVYVLTQYESTGGNVRATGRFPSKGFEIQVNNSHTDRVRTGSLYHVSDVVDESPAKDDEWFTEDIVVRDDTITVSVDGRQVVRWTQPADWDGGREGPGRRITGPGTIALQCHDPNSTVYYRNIRIKPLETAAVRPRLTVKRTADFEVTGKGDNSAWQKTDWTALARRQADGHPYDTRFKMLYSDTGLYFLMDGTDKTLTATMTEDFMDLWNEDVFEVFLWPDDRYPVYFEYEISPLNHELPIIVPNFGGKFLGWRPWHYEKDRLIRKATSVSGGAKEPHASIDGWRAEFFFPYALLTPLQNVPPKPGTAWRANFYRMDHDGGKRTQWGWVPLDNFHLYEQFGEIVFE